MTHKSSWTAMLASCLMLASASVFGAEIRDQGKFFSPEAIKTANRKISELESKYHHQIHLETYAVVPSDKAAAVAQMKHAERDAFFRSWIVDRAKATNARGLFVLICKEPAHIHADLGAGLSRAGFTPQARQRVVDSLMPDFRAKKYDDGLMSAVEQIGAEFAKLPATSAAAHRAVPAVPVHRVNHPPAQPANYTGLIMIGVLIVGGLILLRVLGRAFSGVGGYQPGMGGMGMGGGGGGFGSGLMGGLFGALAGNWLYNSFSHPHGGQANGGETQPTVFGNDDSSNTSDFGGNSSDFGSGADFGGNDFGGGGDFGGGDFGGGGDF